VGSGADWTCGSTTPRDTLTGEAASGRSAQLQELLAVDATATMLLSRDVGNG
jgi:hypothetical protein